MNIIASFQDGVPRRKPKKAKATLAHILVEMDEPYLVLLEGDAAKKIKYIASAICDEDPARQMFLAAKVTPDALSLYFEQKRDLRSLFAGWFVPSRYFFDLAGKSVGDEITLMPVPEHIDDDLLPQHGTFAYIHDNPYAGPADAEGQEKIYVNGKWELQDFGELQQAYTHIYNLSIILNGFKGLSIDDAKAKRAIDRLRSTLKHSTQGRNDESHVRPYSGGGSYVHFLKDFSGIVPVNDRVALEAIKVASPGFIAVRGKQDAFKSSAALIERLLSTPKAINASYNKLHKFLSESKLLKIDVYVYQKAPSRVDDILELAQDLYDNMGLSHFKMIHTSCDNNALLTAKITLSLYRRLKGISSFFMEGRASFTPHHDEQYNV